MQMQEAPAVIVGEIMSTKKTYARSADGNGRGPEDGGLKVAVFSDGFYGQKGATEVKLEASAVEAFRPRPGDKIAWVVRFGMYAVEGNKGVTCGFVGPAAEPIVQVILDHSAPTASGKTAA